MKKRYSLGVIGADHRTGVIAERLGVSSPFSFGPLDLVKFAASPAGTDEDLARAQAESAGVPLGCWEEVAADPAIQAIYVGGPYDQRTRTIVAALNSGKPVICPIPIALSNADLDAIEAARCPNGGVPGLLFTPGNLRATISGGQALGIRASGRLGPLHSIYGAIRTKRRENVAVDVLDELGWEIIDYVEALVSAPLERVYASGAALFGGALHDSMMLNLRYRGDIIVSLEISRSLPPSYPRGFEAEIDICGDESALRIEPHTADVDVLSERTIPGVSERSWHLPPVINMLEEFERLLGDPKPVSIVVAENRALLKTVSLVRRSLEKGDAVLA